MKNFKYFLLLLVFGCANNLVKVDPNGVTENRGDLFKNPYVIMISIDGFRHDYIEKYQPPFLSSIEKKGIQADFLRPIFPSKTFPNHYTLVTGLYAENHGLVANRFHDPDWNEDYQIGNSSITTDGKWYGGSPLWISVREQGLLSASFFWVGSDANIKGLYPNYYVPYDGKVKNSVRVDQIDEWLELPEEKRPHYLTLYFSDVDSAGHRYGPDAQETKDAVLKVDSHIKDLYEEIKEKDLPINIVIVSDHGMMTIDNKRKVYLNEFVDPDKAIFMERGPITLIYLKDKNDLKGYKKALQKVPYTKVYERKELPKKFHFKGSKRAGDLILLAEPGAYIYPLKKRPEAIEMDTNGTHGYDPYLSKEMSGIFLAFGPNIRERGRIPGFQNIHVYPFIMKLLGLEVKKKIDGKETTLRRYLKNTPSEAL